MKKADNIFTNGTWNKKLSRRNDKLPTKSHNNPAAAMGGESSSSDKWNLHFNAEKNEFEMKTPATSKYVAEFHPLSYLFTVVRGNLEDDSDKDGNPRLPTAISGVLNRKLGQEFNAKIVKLNREIDDIQKRIDGMHEKVNSLNKERCDPDSSNNGRNFGNEIYLLVRNVGMWMRRMETKAQIIERIEWSMYILEALQEIDESCNATMFWTYVAWRKVQFKIQADGDSSDWDEDLGNNEPKYDKFSCENDPEIIRLFKLYEAAYRRNIDISKLIKDDLLRSGSDEKLSRFVEDNYTRCKVCKALFSKRYDDLFGTRIHCPSKLKTRENLLTRGTTGEEDGSNLIVCFFCTDCFDIFNPSIIKKINRDKELKIEKDLEVLIREHQQEEDSKNGAGNNISKSNKKRKKKKRKKNKKSNFAPASSSVSITSGAHHRKSGSSTSTQTTATMSTPEKANVMPIEENQSDTEQEGDDEVNLTLNQSYDESQKSVDGSDDRNNDNSNDIQQQYNANSYDDDVSTDGIDVEGDDSSINDLWVDFLMKTNSIIELNAFMDKKIGKEKD